jgi:hypothetical protein
VHRLGDRQLQLGVQAPFVSGAPLDVPDGLIGREVGGLDLGLSVDFVPAVVVEDEREGPDAARPPFAGAYQADVAPAHHQAVGEAGVVHTALGDGRIMRQWSQLRTIRRGGSYGAMQ